MKLIVCAKKNAASTNMHSLFISEFGFKETKEEFDNHKVYQKEDFKLIFINRTILEIDFLKEHFHPDIYLVASTHKSASGTKSLTSHPTGNYKDAVLGGQEKTLCLTSAVHMSSALRFFQNHPLDNYEVSFEATHHGPSVMNAPVVYVEVGSTETEWNDLDACRRVCQAILAKTEEKPSAIGFGGTHYCLNFTKASERCNLGHMCPKHFILELNNDLINQMIVKTLPNPRIALLDWKGMNSEQKRHIVALLENADLEIVKI